MSEPEHDPTESAADEEPEDTDEVDADDETDDDGAQRRPGGPGEPRNVGG